MKWPRSITLLAFNFLTHVIPAVANVEKAVFIAPEPLVVPLDPPSFANLNLPTLRPGSHHGPSNSIRTALDRSFPSDAPGSASGQATWLLLDDLVEKQRYEVRVCWSAIEPTAFTMDVFELNTVWETPDLIQSLAEFAFSRQPDAASEDSKPGVYTPSTESAGEKETSILLLRVLAAADYFTDNATLMSDPEPVLVDLILDPFLCNVLPRSLLPTVGYILAVAAVSWFVAQWIAARVQSMAAPTQAASSRKKR